MMNPATALPYEDDIVKKQELEHPEFGSKEQVSVVDPSNTNVLLETDEFGNEIVHIDQAASDRLRRKIDLHIVPILALQYLFAFIDRANIGNARIAGLEKDLKLTGNQYNILLSIFYISYVIFEIPANLFTKWLGPGKAIPLFTVTFGILSLSCAFVNSYGAALAVRFLLGLAEAGLFPGIGYYFGRWYRREEITFRMGLYIACAPLAGGVGGLLASGILKIDGIGQVHSWQQIFLIEGIITTAIGIAAYILMADRPETARWLSPEEKKLAADRIKADQVGSTTLLEGINVRAIKEGIFATTTLVNGLMFMLNNITVTGVAFFAPTIVATIYPTKSTIQKQLYTVPPYIVGALCTCIFPYITTRVKRRGVVMLCTAPLVITGYIIFVSTTNSQARYGALFLILAGSPSFGAFTNGWAAINVASDTARAAALGCVVMMGNCRGLISTWSFMPSDGPNYPIGNFLNLATNITVLGLTGYLLLFIRHNNKKRDAGNYDHHLVGVRPEEAYKLGNNHPGFRYKT